MARGRRRVGRAIDFGNRNSVNVMATSGHFKVSTHLKDIIGRDLVTNEFVAVFELAKNAIDAWATRVDIGFDLDDDRIWIVDNGKGMDADALRERWLFVAYSAKADGTEDSKKPGGTATKSGPRVSTPGAKG